MKSLEARLRQHASEHPRRTAIVGTQSWMDWATLMAASKRLQQALWAAGVQTVGLYADNGPAWILADLALSFAGLRCVPLPRFFTTAQLRHALTDSGADAVLVDDDRLESELGLPLREATCGGSALRLLAVPRAGVVELPAGTAKLTYTSGTTAEPKGVCLDLAAQLAVAESLIDASGAGAAERHLCVLPLSTLLENIGGVLAPLLAGATVIAPPQAEVGLKGAAGFEPLRLLSAIERHQATSLILVPQLLQGLVLACELAGLHAPASLRFVAVGGAPVGAALLAKAQAQGWPVHEGYGLSEAASVVALNRPGENLPGTVGRPLPHVEVRIADDGEIWVRGATLLGYAGDVPRAPGSWLATGDLGAFDAAGRLCITGRRKSVYSTAYGRNVAPEWVECELTRQPAIAQAAVFGEARPWNVALLTPRALPGATLPLAEAVAAANAVLPDYAQIRHWLTTDEPFSADNGLLTSNGRVRRDAVAARYGDRLDSLFAEEQAHS